MSGRRPGTPVAIGCRAGAGTGGGHAGETGHWRGLAAAAVLALSAAAYFYLHRAPKLTDKDTLVLADFENKTGDPVFDDTLRQGLSVELQQSPFLSLISDQQVQQTLGLMNRPAETRADSGDRAGNLRANRQRRRSGRLDRKPRKPICAGAARQELPHRRHPGPGAGAGGNEGRCPEFAEPDRAFRSGPGWANRWPPFRSTRRRWRRQRRRRSKL